MDSLCRLNKMKSQITEIVDHVVEVTGNDKLHSEVDCILDKHESLIAKVEHTGTHSEIQEILHLEEKDVERDVHLATQMGELLEAKWRAETSQKIAESELQRIQLLDLEKRIQKSLNDSSFSFNTSEERPNPINTIRTNLLEQKINNLRAGTNEIRSTMRRYKVGKWWRQLKFHGFDFLWDFGLPVILFLIGLLGMLLDPIAGIVFSALLTIAGWIVGRWVLKPWLDRQMFAKQKNNTLETIGRFYFSLITIRCNLALLDFQAAETRENAT